MTNEVRIYGVAHTARVIVNFMVKSAIQLLGECGVALNQINALDPFTGDGVYIESLLSHGVDRITAYEIRDWQYQETERKYRDKAKLVHTDAFLMSLRGVNLIIGNPPYGKCAKNDSVDSRIRKTYGGCATNQQSLYDGYVRAIRWASDNLKNGVIAYVVNSGFIEGVAFGNFRKCVEREFEKVYIVNLRGNHRSSGERCRQEGGNVFGAECRTGIAILFLVRKYSEQKSPAGAGQKPNHNVVYLQK